MSPKTNTTQASDGTRVALPKPTYKARFEINISKGESL